MSLCEAMESVKDWNQAFGHVDPEFYQQARLWQGDSEESKACRELALQLVEEEVAELREAVENKDQIETLDAICDIFVVVLGLAAKAGLQHKVDPAFNEVMRSNWSKLDESGKPVYYDNGKIAKSDRYEAPDLTKFFTEVN